MIQLGWKLAKLATGTYILCYWWKREDYEKNAPLIQSKSLKIVKKCILFEKKRVSQAIRGSKWVQIVDIIKLQVFGYHILFTESKNTFPKPSNGCFKMATHDRAGGSTFNMPARSWDINFIENLFHNRRHAVAVQVRTEHWKRDIQWICKTSNECNKVDDLPCHGNCAPARALQRYNW